MRKTAPSVNKLKQEDESIHNWYRFVLSFPAHLVKEYLEKLLIADGKGKLLDPFCGTATTLVEAKKMNIPSIGVEALPMCFFASKVKTRWDIDIKRVSRNIDNRVKKLEDEFSQYGFLNGDDLFHVNIPHPEPCPCQMPEDQKGLLGKGYVSARPLSKLLVVRRMADSMRDIEARDLWLLALAKTSIEASNVGFGPEIYAKKEKADADVFTIFSARLKRMILDLKRIQETNYARTSVIHEDARLLNELKPASVETVLTSPPYPNEKNYARITRIESVILGFMRSKKDLRTSKELLIRSNSNNVYKGDNDDENVKRFKSITSIADEIQKRNVELNKTSGFEKLYPRVVTLYFGGMYLHLKRIYEILKSGGRCGYVVGDQMSYHMVHIKTGQLLAELAEDIGFQVSDIELWRERPSTASGQMIREEVLMLRKP